MGRDRRLFLIEPSPGLWLLMLDANVFTYRGGIWHLNANGAWNHVLSGRGHIEPWIADVVQKADATGATLLAFSHYPMIAFDALHTPSAGRHRRVPDSTAAERLARTGLKWHSSGHMHAAGQASCRGLANVGVPPAYHGQSVDGHDCVHRRCLSDFLCAVL